MSPQELAAFKEIWSTDFEFNQPAGHRPTPICLVAQELRTSRTIRIWEDDLARLSSPPYPTGPDSLFVAYYASAELGCHLALDWPLPTFVLDLYVEFKCLANGRTTPCGSGLLGALTYFGLDSMSHIEKGEMRRLAMRGGPWSDDERIGVLDYCASDVVALSKLLLAMEKHIDLPRALLRGRYMKAAALIESVGVPIDTKILKGLKTHWEEIQLKLISRIDQVYGVFEGRTFKIDRFEEWLKWKQIPWPRLESGRLALDDDTFREAARSYPDIAPLRELRVSLSQMRLADLAVGPDGRNRLLLSAFQSRTGRNQPSNSRSIFGPAVWYRSLIRPQPGWGLAYIDWEQQEVGIAAALSEDPAMQQAYLSGDPYLSLAKLAGAVPADATKETHRVERDRFKACVLAVQYGMGPNSLAQRIGQLELIAKDLIEKHRRSFKRFWEWSDAVLDHAMLHGELWTVFGWKLHVGYNANPRSIRNFPMQANGAEMLRLACIFATEAGIRICAPIHDAILIEAPLDQLDETVEATRRVMKKASEIVLSGFELRTETYCVRYPDRYEDRRGRTVWRTIMNILSGLEKEHPPCSLLGHEGGCRRSPVPSYISIP